MTVHRTTLLSGQSDCNSSLTLPHYVLYVKPPLLSPSPPYCSSSASYCIAGSKLLLTIPTPPITSKAIPLKPKQLNMAEPQEPLHSASGSTTVDDEVFPPMEALPRSILVGNISPLATSATLEDFFSFCGAIETQRLRKLPSGVQQAVVIFSDERARENALVMNDSPIIDTRVTITTVTPSFNFFEEPISTPPPQQGGMFGGFSAFGDLFAGVGTAVAAEVQKASHAIEKATDSGVLKSAKDQMVLARKKTAEIATDLDNKWKVRENVKNVADVSREQATVVASAVATQTSNLATQVDRSLNITENTGKLAEKARENAGIKAVAGGFQSLLAQTGLQNNANGDSGVNGGVGNGNETSQTSTAETSSTTNETQQQTSNTGAQ